MNISAMRRPSFLSIACVIFILFVQVGCGPSPSELAEVDYAPLPGDDWEVSTPEDHGLDPDLLAELYYNAARLDTLYSLLIIKDGYLIAEGYFNGGTVDQMYQLQSVTKSYTATLVGIALDQGCLLHLDQRMMDFFPEFADRIDDPRKELITIRHLLQMRSGFPNEESHPDFWEALLSGNYLRLIVGFPLVSDPGTDFNYSGLSSHLLGVIVSRACEIDLMSFAREHLFSPMDAEVGDDWIQDTDGYYIGLAGMHVTARDMAKLGLLYLNDGEYQGNQIVSEDWVHESFQAYSEDPVDDWGLSYSYEGYGYQWWLIEAGDHHYSMARGHGGQLIVILDDLAMVIVATADPFWQQHDDESWRHERSINNLVADFIRSLPGE